MQSTIQLVDSIANRLQVVVSQMKNLQDENKALHERLDVSKQELEQKSNTIRDLRMKLEAAKTAKSIKGVGQSSTKAKTQIDKLIAEIDACLEFLSLS
jgi:predicted  nucleic acid-binding Zn-ribbon protein